MKSLIVYSIPAFFILIAIEFILDKLKKTNWGRFTPTYLPPYSPDLNPIERIWGYLKENFFNDFSAKDLQQLITQLDFALLALFKNKHIITSVTNKVSS